MTNEHDSEQLVELRIDSLAAGGDGVARDDAGRVTFVRRGVPGDVARVRVTQQKKSFARGDIVEVVSPSPARVEPPCALFVSAECGGCTWQHIARDQQVRSKQEMVAAALRRAVAAGLTLAPARAPGDDFGWRRRARLQWVRRRQDRAALVGFYGARGKRVVDVAQCPQLAPALQAGLDAIRAHLAPALTGRGELEMLVGHDGAVHIAVRGPCKPAALRGLVDAGHIAGARLGKQSLGTPIELEPGFRATADQFAQASAAGNAALREAVLSLVGPRDGVRVLELYAGTGNLTRDLSQSAREVVAVDSAPGIASGAPLVNVEARQGAAVDVVRALARKDPDFDVVVLDPPRTGAADVMSALVRLAAPRVVYVSCDAATMARDLDVLMRGGYRPERGQVIDMMPQTPHVEVVVALTLDEASDAPGTA